MEVNKDTKRLIVNGINPVYPLIIEKYPGGISFQVGNVMTGCTGMIINNKDLPLIIDFLKSLEKDTILAEDVKK